MSEVHQKSCDVPGRLNIAYTSGTDEMPFYQLGEESMERVVLPEAHRILDASEGGLATSGLVYAPPASFDTIPAHPEPIGSIMAEIE